MIKIDQFHAKKEASILSMKDKPNCVFYDLTSTNFRRSTYPFSSESASHTSSKFQTSHPYSNSKQILMKKGKFIISGTNPQNPFPLYLVKLRNRALKFLVHFSLVCLGKYPKPHEKWLPMGQGIWGSISHPSGMLWRPFRDRFLQILQPKGVFRIEFHNNTNQKAH